MLGGTGRSSLAKGGVMIMRRHVVKILLWSIALTMVIAPRVTSSLPHTTLDKQYTRKLRDESLELRDLQENRTLSGPYYTEHAVLPRQISGAD